MQGFDLFTVLTFAFIFVVVLTVWKGIKIVPQQEIWTVERLGKYHRDLQPGLHIIHPVIERVSIRPSLKKTLGGSGLKELMLEGILEESLEAGTEVVITGKEGYQLKVRRKS